MMTLTLPAGLVNPNPSRHGIRAPKGGCTVGGKLYRGGQFCLPFDPENPHGLEVSPPAPAFEPAPMDNPRDSWPEWTGEERWTTVEPAPSGLDLSGFASRLDGPAPARVEFSIHGFRYAAREVPAGGCGSVAFELHKHETNHRYHVIRDGFGVVSCDCPDYLFRHEGTGRTCKHGSKLVELGLVPAPTPVPSTLGRREFITPLASVLRNATPDRVECSATRPRRFEPSPEEMAEAAQLFGDAVAGRVAYRRELAAAL